MDSTIFEKIMIVMMALVLVAFLVVGAFVMTSISDVAECFRSGKCSMPILNANKPVPIQKQ